MKRFVLSMMVMALVAISVGSAQADWGLHSGRVADRWAARHARGMSWHANYYHTATGGPVSLIVPPTAHMQTQWAWGVSQNTMTPIYHQFRRSTLGGDVGGGGELLQPTPNWPSHTDQFGVFYNRGPY